MPGTVLGYCFNNSKKAEKLRYFKHDTRQQVKFEGPLVSRIEYHLYNKYQGQSTLEQQKKEKTLKCDFIITNF